jgi:hypothetical protein
VRFATEGAYRAALRTWRAGKPANRLEVNHRRPALGAHGTLSCVHHLENLETLCVACHRETTAQMRPRRPKTARAENEAGTAYSPK